MTKKTTKKKTPLKTTKRPPPATQKLPKLAVGEWRKVMRACTCESTRKRHEACEPNGAAMRCFGSIDKWQSILEAKAVTP